MRSVGAAITLSMLSMVSLGCSPSSELTDECPIEQCPMARCTCKGGAVTMLDRCRNGPCVSAQSICASDLRCSEALESAVAAPDRSVAGSPECKAYCAKAASSTPCVPTCIERESCWNDEAKCEASMRAYLQCLVDKGTWGVCFVHPNAYGVCVVDNSVCSADAATGG